MALYMTANVYLNYTNIGYVGSQGISYQEKVEGPMVAAAYQDVVLTISGGAPDTDFFWETGETSGIGVLSDAGESSITVSHLEPRDYVYKFGFAGTGNIVNYKISITVVPWSVTLLGYGTAPATVNEGTTLTFAITAPPSAPEDLTAYLVISDPATIDMHDIVRPSNSGVILMTGRTGTATVDIVADMATEGTEHFTVWVEQPAGFLVGSYGRVNIADTSKLTVISLVPIELPYAIVGVPYSSGVIATGGTAPYTYELTQGTIPTGMVLNENGTLSGTPTAAGTAAFTITATDSNGFDGSRSYTLDVIIILINLDMPSLNGNKNVPYTNTVTASGGGAPYTYTVTAGSLPIGLAMNSSGQITGTPTRSGNSTFTVRATDKHGITKTRQFTISIAGATIILLPPTMPQAVLGEYYSFQLSASGGVAPYSFYIIDTLTFTSQIPGGPIGLQIDGLYRGMAYYPGTYVMLIKAEDSTGDTGVQEYTLVIA